MRIQVRVEEYRLRCGMTNAVQAIITVKLRYIAGLNITLYQQRKDKR